MNMKKILVVEDEKTLSEIISMKLREEGYEVENAYNGEEALQKLTESSTLPDLLLLDILLPKVNGLEVLAKIRQSGNDRLTAIPVMIFSNFAHEEEVQKAKDLGAVDYIVKAAFSPAEIVTKVKNILASSGTESDVVSGTAEAAPNPSGATSTPPAV